jgi:hypothetical protein
VVGMAFEVEKNTAGVAGAPADAAARRGQRFC